VSHGQINLLDEIIVDNFAGGGGASTGIELATGRVVDIAINHDPDAILMHRTNHPHNHTLSGQRVGRGPGGGVRRPPGGAGLVFPGL
jgi:site-specific DNA-cytosine methylase